MEFHEYDPFEEDVNGGEIYELVYDKKVKGYAKRRSGELLDFRVVTQHDYFQYKAGNVTHLFPYYNETDHFITELHNAGQTSLAIHKNGTLNIQMPYGTYYFTKTNYEWIMRSYDISKNSYVNIKQSAGAALVEVYQDFLGRKSLYEKENELHRSGTFLYGPPGCGKTREIIRLSDKAEELQFYMLFIDTRMPITAIIDFKELFKEKNVIIVIEEITDRMSRHDLESLLSFLDGEASWNNCYVIATSNYPELMPANIIDRPGRFNKIIEVSYPSKEQKEAYLIGKNISSEDIVYLLKELPEKLSVDYLREIVLLHKTTNKAFPNIIQEIKEMRAKVSSAFKAGITLNKGK